MAFFLRLVPGLILVFFACGAGDTAHGQGREVEMWNRVLTAENPSFNTQPNAFLVEMTDSLTPGRALDVGMGQGRNALWLAGKGWEVTGFDPADRAVAAAKAESDKLGLKLTALVQRDSEFDFGRERWDLVVLSYVSCRHLVDRIYDSLKPGGLVVLEAFHRDATAGGVRIGAGVVFDADELPRLFGKFLIVRYEEPTARADFGMKETRLVRLCARKE